MPKAWAAAAKRRGLSHLKQVLSTQVKTALFRGKTTVGLLISQSRFKQKNGSKGSNPTSGWLDTSTEYQGLAIDAKNHGS
jgi:hypothetical protein